MTIDDSYAGAVRSQNLKSVPETTRSHADVLGAAGLAAKRRPLALALLRLFSGDNHASTELVDLLAQMVTTKAWEGDGLVLPPVEAVDLGRMVLAWHRDGVCRVCGGHGFELVEGAPSLSERACRSCRGTRKVAFDDQFPMERLHLARWLRERIEREQAFAGAELLASLAPRLHP